MKGPLKQVLSIILPNNPFLLLKDFFNNFPTCEACCGATVKGLLKKVKKEEAYFIIY